jgi:hypothetical protein
MMMSATKALGQTIHSRFFQEVANTRAVVDMSSLRHLYVDWLNRATRWYQYNSKSWMDRHGANPAAIHSIALKLNG